MRQVGGVWGCRRQREASWLMNWQQPPAKQHRVPTIRPGHLFLNQEVPFLLHLFLICLHFLFIHHHFFMVLFFPERSSIFLITPGLFITDDTLHIALWRYPENEEKKMGFGFTLFSSVLMKRKIEGREAFIFWQNATPGHESLLLLSDFGLAWENTKFDLNTGSPGGDFSDVN